MTRQFLEVAFRIHIETYEESVLRKTFSGTLVVDSWATPILSDADDIAPGPARCHVSHEQCHCRSGELGTSIKCYLSTLFLVLIKINANANKD